MGNAGQISMQSVMPFRMPARIPSVIHRSWSPCLYWIFCASIRFMMGEDQDSRYPSVQNLIMNHREANGKGDSKVYLKTIHNQSCGQVLGSERESLYKRRSRGKSKAEEMQFWIGEGINRVINKRISYRDFWFYTGWKCDWESFWLWIRNRNINVFIEESGCNCVITDSMP